MINSLRTKLLFKVVVLVSSAVAMGAAALTTACTATDPPAHEEGVTDVAMQNIQFVPKEVTIKVGETVRLYFGVGGPNFTSSFHVIGEIFDKVYNQGSLTTAPLKDVQTTTVAPGGAVVVDFKLQVPGKFMIVDHALSRVHKGLAGVLEVTGPDNPDAFKDYDPAKSATSMSH